MKKLLLFSMMCLVTLGIASCDKDSKDTEPSDGDITPAGYVDLGLPSGTKWKDVNETNSNDTCDFYTYDEAIEKFGSKLPTKVQWVELIDECQWTWDDSKRGSKVVGPNGKSIFLPAAGRSDCSGNVCCVLSNGNYWSSTPDGSDDAWSHFFSSGDRHVLISDQCSGRSVRLVQ